MPAAVSSWFVMVLTSIAVVLGRHWSTLTTNDEPLIVPFLTAVPFGLLSFGVFWPAIAAVARRAPANRTTALVLAGIAVAPVAGWIFFTAGYVLWGHGSYWSDMRRLAIRAEPVVVVLTSLVSGGATFGFVFARTGGSSGSTRDDASHR